MTTTTTPPFEPAVLPVIEVDANAAARSAARVADLPRRPKLDLFLVSFLILFFELTCIRWFGSTVVFLTFFTNIVLLATFLGMSVGLLTAGRRRQFQRWVLPLAFLAVLLSMGTFWAYHHYADRLTIDVGGQAAKPKLIYFGTEYRPADPSKFIIPLWAVAGAFFTLIAVTFVGLGQTMGRAFDAIPNRVLAYTTDVLGSLTGISVFFAMSWFRLSPHVWFIVAVALALYFVRRRLTLTQVFSAMGVMFVVAMGSYGVAHRGQIFWSPYYKVAYDHSTGFIDTNNISHQEMVKIWDTGDRYALPHLLNRDAGNAPFDDVLIIGAGSGNDVAAAELNGAKKIDAVEIDPTINQIGRWYHPDKPYDDPRLKVVHDPNQWGTHFDDGRSFVRKTDHQYDLAVYALVDSLVLHSGYSSLRLENFLFTEEALRDVKARLKPGGVFAMYNYFRFGWVAGRLTQMVKKVYGVEPVVVTLGPPDEATITRMNPDDNLKDVITFLLVGTDSAKLNAIKKKFETDKNFWLNLHPDENRAINGFRELKPDESRWWRRVTPVSVNSAGIKLLPSDDWPQLYLRERAIPWAPNGQGMLVVAVMSVVILLAFTLPVWFGKRDALVPRARPNGQMFFLGAGFMLLETKGVVHMALLFGSTWVVNSVVFFAILVMILISNLFVLAVRPRKLWPYYALLAVTLLANVVVPMRVYLGMPGAWKVAASCAVVFVPVFFAGVIFATCFRDSKQPDVDFGCNVAGIILGGLSEQLSMVVGFNYLLLVAVLYYVLSALLQPRTKRPAPEVPVTDAPPPQVITSPVPAPEIVTA